MWSNLSLCYERPEKYLAEALQQITDFRRYKMSDTANREFYSLLRVAIKGARTVGHLKLLINEQPMPGIVVKMSPTDWKQWAMDRPS
jgi:hypothetical protein